MRVLSLDFWDTLYRHCRTAEYRAQARAAHLLEYCQAQAVEEPEKIASTFFTVIDSFIKNSWREGVCPLPPAILDHAVAHYTNHYSRDTILQLIAELNHIYTTDLKPELFAGATDFLLWAKSRLSLYLISDTYTLRSDALDAVLEADGLKEVFRARFYSDAVGVEKPNVAVMERIIEAEGVAAAEIIHVGDLVERDYELARRIGCRFILLRHNSEPVVESNLDDRVLLGQCNSFGALRGIIEGI